MFRRLAFAWLRPKVTRLCSGDGMNSQNRDRALLMAAAQSGDVQAYSCLLREIAPEVRLLLLSARHPPERIDETVNDTLRAIHRLRHTYDPARPFGGWVSAICRHCAG